MTQRNKADQVRKGLLGSVKGKVKQFAGAVTGNDSLTAEGQLEQLQADERRTAAAAESLADAEAERARDEAADARRQGADERLALDTETAAANAAVQGRQDARKRTADQAAQRDVARANVQAETEAQQEMRQAEAAERHELVDAAKDMGDTLDEHRSAVDESVEAQDRADRLRQRAAEVSDQSELP